jgi:DNA adenine methylase
VAQSCAPSAEKARPFLKWAGGKSTLAVEFNKMGLIPKDFNDYFEPFLGGGAVFFYLYNKGFIRSKAYLTDVNKDLVNAYNEIKTRPDQLIEELKSLEGKNSLEFFKECRSEFNALKKEKTAPVKQKTRKAALMIYLNKTCFNGLYRENSKGEFNVPFGDYKNPRILDEVNIRVVSAALRNASISQKDFIYCANEAKEGDFVYFDPPYIPVSQTSNFTTYSGSGFSLEDQEKLVDVFSKLTEKGVMVLYSNSYSDQVRDLFDGVDGAVLNTVSASRFINCNGSGRGPVLEYAITNFKSNVTQTQLELD